MHYKLFLFFLLFGHNVFCQTDSTKNIDTSQKFIYLKEVTIVGRNTRADIHQLPEIVGTEIFAGKKNSLVIIENLNANISNNTMRQVVAKVPGIHVWESDGSGIQIGISSRGLSPNRSWEFNVRQNGYDISSDPFGYPEAYYTPQLQAVQRLQFVRGAGALQYGPQFGGLVNFILHDGSNINKPLQIETQNTFGSFNLFNTYSSIGGKYKKIHYFGFIDHRNANGWRQNSRYNVNTVFATIHYQLNSKLKIGIEYTRWNMRSQQPGGIVDTDLNINAQMSSRSRNWMDIDWTIAAFTADYFLNQNKRFQFKLFNVRGDRNSIAFVRPINIKDTINALTLQYNNRTIDIDRYNNTGAELRFLNDYSIGKLSATLSAGIRMFYGKTDRFRNGKGDTGTEFNTNLQELKFPVDFDLNSKNYAAFFENIFRITSRWIFIPGVRYEFIQTNVQGRLGLNSNGSEIKAEDLKRTRRFFLIAAGTEYHITPTTEFYANYSQAYRPLLFSDLTISSTTDVIDPDLKDSKGFSTDIGFRGKVKDYLFFDVSIFYLNYQNRVGNITQQNNTGNFFTYRTNVGNSISKGWESLIEFNPIKAFFKKSKLGSINLFFSHGFTKAVYGNVKVVNRFGNQLIETNLKNKKVENAPEHILRAGFTWNYKSLSFTTQFNFVSGTFTDANNTIEPNANAQNGWIPSYHIWDVSGTYRLSEKVTIRSGLNNVFDKRYATRRSGGFPGPGLLPSDSRNFYCSLGIKL